MKKLMLAICLAFLSIGAFASTPSTPVSNVIYHSQSKSFKTERATGQFFDASYTVTSSCGVVWEVTAPEDAPLSAHVRMWAAIEAACGTATDYIEISY